MVKTLLVFVCTLSLLAGVVPGAYAVEQDPSTGMGYLLTKMAKELLVEEFPDDSDEPISVTYLIDENTRFSNFESLDEVMEYDDLEITYKLVEGKRVAISIFKIQSYTEFENETDLDMDGKEIEDSDLQDY